MKNFLSRFSSCNAGRRTGQSHADRRIGQSTVELALILPILVGLLFLVIYVFRINHTANQETISTYAERIEKFDHGNGEIFDPVKGIYVPAGQYSEVIPPSAIIDLSQLAEMVAQNLAALGLNALFGNLQIFNDEKFLGAFAEGFTYSLANSTVSTYIETGSLHDMSAEDLESATWAGFTSGFSSDQASDFFQGADQTGSSAQEFFGSGAQAGLIGFSQSEGDWQAGATSALGGMINSDTTSNWINDGKAVEQILKGAGKGAVQSAASGIFDDNFDVKSVLAGAASGAVSTSAFADVLPLTGDDPTNSAMYGAFNGAFSSVLSGGDLQTTLFASGAGALGSQQTTDALGKWGSRASTVGYSAANQYASGQSLGAIGLGALISFGSYGVGWAGNKVSSSIIDAFGKAESSNDITMILNNNNTSDSLASDDSFNQSTDQILNGATEGFLNAQFLESLMLMWEGTS